MRTYFIIIGILLLTYGAYYSALYALMPSPPMKIGKEKMQLSIVTQVASNVALGQGWITPPGSTLLFYIYPEIKDRTTWVGNEYVSAVKIGSTQTLKVLIAPDAGRSSMSAPAALEVYVAGSNEPELIEIRDLYLQKWNFVAIVKKGRKFNIYVNGKLSASEMCKSMPDYDSTQPLRIGDSRMGGSIALMSLAPYAMEIDDIRTLYKETSSSDGKPYLNSDAPFLPDFSLPHVIDSLVCPGGNCSSNNSGPGPMNKWSSEYA